MITATIIAAVIAIRHELGYGDSDEEKEAQAEAEKSDGTEMKAIKRACDPEEQSGTRSRQAPS